MTTAQIVEKPRARIEEERSRRRRREDIGTGRLRNLAINGDLDPRYTYRWINDDPGRVHALTVNDDWDVVTHEQINDRDAKDKGTGSGVERIVDKVTGKRAILVRKPLEYYQADKAKEQEALDDLETAIKRGASTSPESLQAQEPGKAYIPQGGIVIKDGRKG